MTEDLSTRKAIRAALRRRGFVSVAKKRAVLRTQS